MATLTGDGERVLVVDDEAAIRKFLQISLSSQGFEVLEAESAEAGLSLCVEAGPSVVILDLGLPDRDGQEVIEAIRAVSGVPIIVLSVRAGEQEKVRALDSGADDYVTKPFGVAELTARVRAVLRSRSRERWAPVFEVGGLRIDRPRHEVTLNGERIRLRPKEFALLFALVHHAGRVLTHRQLLREVWGEAHETDTQYLRVYIGQLRQKLGDDPTRPRFIANEPGVGYRFIDPAAR